MPDAGHSSREIGTSKLLVEVGYLSAVFFFHYVELRDVVGNGQGCGPQVKYGHRGDARFVERPN